MSIRAASLLPVVLLQSFTFSAQAVLGSDATLHLGPEVCTSAPSPPIYFQELKDRSPQIVGHGSNLTVAWTLSDGNWRGVLASSGDSGLTWTAPRLLGPQFQSDRIRGQSASTVANSGRVTVG